MSERRKMGAGAREAELSGSCSAVTRPVLSGHPGTTAKNSESGSDKTEDAIFSKLNAMNCDRANGTRSKFIATNFEQTGQDRNSSRPISGKRDKIEIHRGRFRANAARSKFIGAKQDEPRIERIYRINPLDMFRRPLRKSWKLKVRKLE